MDCRLTIPMDMDDTYKYTNGYKGYIPTDTENTYDTEDTRAKGLLTGNKPVILVLGLMQI